MTAKEYNHQYYLRNKEHITRQNRACWKARPERCRLLGAAAQRRLAARKRETFRTLIRKVKDRPCADCCEKYPHYVIDFDHVRGKKKYTIGRMLARPNLAEIRIEIKKCDVVCANCHRERTHGRETA